MRRLFVAVDVSARVAGARLIKDYFGHRDIQHTVILLLPILGDFKIF